MREGGRLVEGWFKWRDEVRLAGTLALPSPNRPDVQTTGARTFLSVARVGNPVLLSPRTARPVKQTLAPRAPSMGMY